ncbi:Protein bric-a-brac 2, partial [Armadillidium vulgare]
DDSLKKYLNMEVEQQFCLKWNNYYSTLNSTFQKLWHNGTFVDVSLIVEDQKIDCHKIVLSACSTYFEKLLTDHKSHPHPLIVLHDVPFSAVESLVVFMYKGEINVEHDQLAAVLKVAETLKVKGLADSPAISDFTRLRLQPDYQNIPNLAQQFYPGHYLQESLLVPLANSTNTVNIPVRDSSSPVSVGNHPPTFQSLIDSHLKRSATPSSLVLPKKRARHHESVGQSPEESAVESDSMSSRNTPEIDPQEQRVREETAQSLAALSQATINFLPQTTRPPPQLMLAPKMNSVKVKVKQEKSGGHGGKNGEKSYTLKDLEEGIEQVVGGYLTPAKAIARYKVPRRTFFRRLSAVRKERGIPSSKENASENYLRNRTNVSNVQGNGSHSVVNAGLVQENMLNYNKIVGKLTNSNSDATKKEINNQSLITGGVFSLISAANANYDYYLQYLKYNQAASLDPKHPKKEATVDDNSNISTSGNSEQALALVTQNGT